MTQDNKKQPGTNRQRSHTDGKDWPCKDAFLVNPVASMHECTGFTPYKVEIEPEAEHRAELCDVPSSSADGAQPAPPVR